MRLPVIRSVNCNCQTKELKCQCNPEFSFFVKSRAEHGKVNIEYVINENQDWIHQHYVLPSKHV
ncbi:hypothetical protein HOLleu_30087 [Holothuria leucospilota]|uniref:Uncharacterized protein n=1 Tax=Holothuria leucospilota TaxID=206669 RepID=A0A9Q1BJX2_HOLLE|nr:hypothetical protein HOLleu_30087 [Holothuria leucospilota]